MNELATQVVSWLSSLERRPAKTSTKRDDADVVWAVLGQRTKDTLKVIASRQPTTFASLEWTTPALTLELGKLPKGAELTVLREVAARLELASDNRAIPVSLVTGQSKPKQHIVGAAFVKPLAAVTTLVGYGPETQLEALVIGQDELAVVNVDQGSARFGEVVLRAPLSEVNCADLDGTASFAVTVHGQYRPFELAHEFPEEFARAAAHFASRGVAIRKLVTQPDGSRLWA